MKLKSGIIFFSIVEILIGGVTLTAVILSLIKGISAKPPQVLIFVLATAIISAGLGVGIISSNRICYCLLLYFSSIIILSKILILTKIIMLNGALETTIPADLKNTVSILYHSLLIFYFTRSSIRRQFLS